MFYIWVLLVLFIGLWLIVRKGEYIGEVSVGKVVEFSYHQSYLNKYTHIKTDKHVICCGYIHQMNIGDELILKRYKYGKTVFNKDRKSFESGVDMINNLNSLKDFVAMASKKEEPDKEES